MGRRRSSPASEAVAWLKRRSMRLKICLGAALALCALVVLKLTVHNSNHFFMGSESVHAVGLFVLIYKLTTKKTCSGLSLKTQELTALFLFTRFICSASWESNIHSVLYFITLMSTAWVIYMIRFKLKSTYIKELDTLPLYYLVPIIVLAFFVHPYMEQGFLFRVLWALSVYTEALSVLPQLCFMRNAKMIEPFTAHYVFALGVSRFLACAYWIIEIYKTGGRYFYLFVSGYFWFVAAFISEIIQTFILADFCYYYIKSCIEGQLIMRMPV
ncbi:uncharacterized protein LOC132167715 [Corylus avellana]|uniref:uncharacterized protein LOC132167715 n=1 Tax=Corylus avellana TaxID=13451 RepID=UPI001E1EF44B|nr:uncharacterized protein LOC132167715 [Corylus avellana]